MTLSEAFKLRRQSPFTLMSAASQAESGPAKPAANRELNLRNQSSRSWVVIAEALLPRQYDTRTMRRPRKPLELGSVTVFVAPKKNYKKCAQKGKRKEKERGGFRFHSLLYQLFYCF
jgi:hypothetical protein